MQRTSWIQHVLDNHYIRRHNVEWRLHVSILCLHNISFAKTLHRTVYGFMAIVICLFPHPSASSKRCILFTLLRLTLTVSAETRGRTVQKDRFQTRRERLCLRLPPCPQFLLAISRPLYPVAIVFFGSTAALSFALYSANVLLPSSSTQILKCSFCLDTTSNSLLLSFDWFIVHLPPPIFGNESVLIVAWTTSCHDAISIWTSKFASRVRSANLPRPTRVLININKYTKISTIAIPSRQYWWPWWRCHLDLSISTHFGHLEPSSLQNKAGHEKTPISASQASICGLSNPGNHWKLWHMIGQVDLSTVYLEVECRRLKVGINTWYMYAYLNQ